MTVSYPLTLPSTPEFKLTDWGVRPVVGQTRSSFTLETQEHSFSGSVWQGDLELPPMSAADAGPWLATLVSLRGRLGTFKLGDPDRKEPQGSAAGSGTVDSIDSTNTQLTTSGWNANESNLLLQGDYIEVNGELKMVVKDTSSDGSGNATIDVEPAFRADPSGNSIVTSSPEGTFRLPSNDNFWQAEENSVYRITIPFIEAF